MMALILLNTLLNMVLKAVTRAYWNDEYVTALSEAIPASEQPVRNEVALDNQFAQPKGELINVKVGDTVYFRGSPYEVDGFFDGIRSYVRIVDDKGATELVGLDEFSTNEPPKSEIVPEFSTYDEAQSAIDSFENGLEKKYGEDAVFNAPILDDGQYLGLDKPETPLTPQELSKLKGLYAQRDSIGKSDDKQAIEGLYKNIPYDGPATKKEVQRALQTYTKKSQQ